MVFYNVYIGNVANCGRLPWPYVPMSLLLVASGMPWQGLDCLFIWIHCDRISGQHWPNVAAKKIGRYHIHWSPFLVLLQASNCLGSLGLYLVPF